MAKVTCPQTLCVFHSSKGFARHCPVCAECNAPSNVIEDDTCVNCWNCWNDSGFIRKGDPELRLLVIKKQKEQEIEIRR